MSGVWFTSDLHFGHRLVARHRGFGDDTMAHDTAIYDNWTKVVAKDDVVWVLGDLALNSVGRALEVIGSLPGRKHLIAGNHDPCHPMHRAAHKWQRRYLEAFVSVQPFARQKIDGQEVLLSHFPYDKDRHEVRYTQYRLPNEGKWLLHGHTHDAYQKREGKEIHVGVDAWELSPVSINTIVDLMREPEPEPRQWTSEIQPE